MASWPVNSQGLNTMLKPFFTMSDIRILAGGMAFLAGPEDGAMVSCFLLREALEHLAGRHVDAANWQYVFDRHASRIGEVAEQLLSQGAVRPPVILRTAHFS